jgi:hypothetical protein
MNQKTLSEVVVRVTRDPMMKPSTTVYEHEVPILAALHGEDAVEVVERYDVKVPEGFTVEDEFERLRMKYNRRTKPGRGNVLRAAYRNGPKDLAEVIGMSLSGRVSKRFQTESVQKISDPRRVDKKVVDTTMPVTLRADREGRVFAETDALVAKEATSPRVKDLAQPVNVGGEGLVPNPPLEGQPGEPKGSKVLERAEKLQEAGSARPSRKTTTKVAAKAKGAAKPKTAAKRKG